MELLQQDLIPACLVARSDLQTFASEILFLYWKRDRISIALLSGSAIDDAYCRTDKN